mgnify:CR=1 FL=1
MQILHYLHMEKLIGRELEKKELIKCCESERSEFVIIYGRRRIGKTFLITNTFRDRFSFLFTGSHKSPKKRQLELFAKAITKYGNISYPLAFESWYEAFDALEKMLEQKKGKGKKILFFDEMPWIDTTGSEFVAALEDFWNTWATLRDDIYLIASGSATSWMVNNIVENQGGLHNRITSTINLRPFNLVECESYLKSHGCTWDRYTIAQSYMYLGGVPYYYSLLDFNSDLGKNIDDLFFVHKAKLRNEFNDLYNVLFNRSSHYIEIVRILASKREGMTRKELAIKTGSDGGGLTKRLINLERCDFITFTPQYGNKKKDSLIRLTDFFTLFYLKFIESEPTHTSEFWRHKMFRPEVIAWQGLTFELICLMHVRQIKQSLGISGILTTEYTWRSKNNGDEGKCQIDLIIERADRCVNLCEIKFTTEPFVITKEYEMKLRNRMSIFRNSTKSKKTLLTTFITTYGVSKGIHSGVVQSEVVLDDLYTN